MHLGWARKRSQDGAFATIAAPNTPAVAGVYADRCNLSGGPPAGYEILPTRHPRPTPGLSESELTCERNGLKRKKCPFSDAEGSRSVSCNLPLLSVPGRYRLASLMQLVRPVTRTTGVSCPMPNHSQLQRVEAARSGMATSCANPIPQFDEFRLPLARALARLPVAALHHPNGNEGRLPRFPSPPRP